MSNYCFDPQKRPCRSNQNGYQIEEFVFKWHADDPHSYFLSCLRHDSFISLKGKALICNRDTICRARQCKISTQASLHFGSMSKTLEFFENPQNCTVINLTLFPCNVAKNKTNRYRVRKHGNLPFHLVLAQILCNHNQKQKHLPSIR